MEEKKRRTRGPKKARPITSSRRLFDISETAEILGVSKALILKLIAEDKLTSHKIAGRRMISREVIDKLIADTCEPATSAM